MPKISVVNDEISPSQLPETIDRANGVLEKAGLSDLATIKSNTVKALNESGASLNQCAHTLGELMQLSDDDAVRLRAAKEALTLHGAFDRAAGEDGKVVFVIEGNAQLNQIFNPTRSLES